MYKCFSSLCLRHICYCPIGVLRSLKAIVTVESDLLEVIIATISLSKPLVLGDFLTLGHLLPLVYT